MWLQEFDVRYVRNFSGLPPRKVRKVLRNLQGLIGGLLWLKLAGFPIQKEWNSKSKCFRKRPVFFFAKFINGFKMVGMNDFSQIYKSCRFFFLTNRLAVPTVFFNTSYLNNFNSGFHWKTAHLSIATKDGFTLSWNGPDRLFGGDLGCRSCLEEWWRLATVGRMMKNLYPIPQDSWDWYIYLHWSHKNQPNVGNYIYHTWMVWEKYDLTSICPNPSKSMRLD